MDDKVIELLVEIKGEVGEVKGLVAAAAIAASNADRRAETLEARTVERLEKIEGRTSLLENSRYWLLGVASAAGAAFGLVPHLISLLHP